MVLVTDVLTLKVFVAAVVAPQFLVTGETRWLGPRLFALNWTSTNSQFSSLSESAEQSAVTSEGVAAPASFMSGTITARAATGARTRVTRFFLLRWLLARGEGVVMGSPGG